MTKYAIFVVSDYWGDHVPGELAGPFDTREDAIVWHRATFPLDPPDDVAAYDELVRELVDPDDLTVVPLDSSKPGDPPNGVSAETAGEILADILDRKDEERS